MQKNITNNEQIAFITSGFLPVPATKGGAVESLVQNLIDVNECEKREKIKIFSIYDNIADTESISYKNTKFDFYKPSKLVKLLDKILFGIITKILKKEKKTSYKFIVQRVLYLNYVSKKLKKNNYKVVIVENNATLFLALKWRKNYKKYENRYYFHLHNDLDCLYGCDNIINKCRKIITVSSYISKIVEERLNYNKNDIIVVKNCIDTHRFNKKYNLEEIAQIRKQYNIKKNDKVIIFVGRTIKEKGILEVLEAVNTLKNNNWKLLIVGSAGFDLNFQSEFENKLYKNTKKNNNIIFTGFIPYKDIGVYYAMADVAVLPSMWDEPAGLTMLETIVSGTKLITTDSGGIPEYVKEYGATILKRDENLVENINKELNNILLKGVKIDKNLVNKCCKEYNLKDYLKKFLNSIDIKK